MGETDTEANMLNVYADGDPRMPHKLAEVRPDWTVVIYDATWAFHNPGEVTKLLMFAANGKARAAERDGK